MTRFSISILLIALAACTSERSDSASQAVASSTASAVLSSPPSGDSKAPFEFPEGYYIPDSSIDYNSAHLEWLELREHGDPNTVNHRYPAQLVISRAGSDTTVSACDTPLVRADTLEVHCGATPLGTVVVRGSFFNDFIRPGRDTIKVNFSERLVANVTITIEKGGRVLLFQRTGLAYWLGE
jgi:hypothetical protein